MAALNIVTLALGGDAWHEQLVVWTAEIGVVLIVAGMLGGIYRLLRGPHLADRALAVDTIAVQLIGLVILLSIRLGTLVYFDGILVLSLLSFAGTVAIAQYIGRPHQDKKTDAPNRGIRKCRKTRGFS